MAKQTIGVGTTANDGTGDTLRAAALKINANTTELYDFKDTPAEIADVVGLRAELDAAVADGAVTTVKIADTAVTEAKLSVSVQTKLNAVGDGSSSDVNTITLGASERHISLTVSDPPADFELRGKTVLNGGKTPIYVYQHTVNRVVIEDLVLNQPAEKGILTGRNFDEGPGKPFVLMQNLIDSGTVSIDRLEINGPMVFSGDSSDQHGGLFNYQPFSKFGTVILDGVGHASAVECDGYYSKGGGTHVDHLIVRNMVSGTSTNVLCNIKGADEYISAVQGIGAAQSIGRAWLIGTGGRAGTAYAASTQTGFQTEVSWVTSGTLRIENCWVAMELGSGEGGQSQFDCVMLYGPDAYHLRNDSDPTHGTDPFQTTTIGITGGTLDKGGLNIKNGIIEGFNKGISLGPATTVPDIGATTIGPIQMRGVDDASAGSAFDIGRSGTPTRGFYCAAECDDKWANWGRLQSVYDFKITGRVPNKTDVLASSSVDLEGVISNQTRTVSTSSGSAVSFLRLALGGDGQYLKLEGVLEVKDVADTWLYRRKFAANYRDEGTPVVDAGAAFVGTAYQTGTPEVPIVIFNISSSMARMQIDPPSATPMLWSVRWTATWTKASNT